MRIISKWKDYYDFIGHVYGGQQDNLRVYERKHLSDTANGFSRTDVLLPLRSTPKAKWLTNRVCCSYLFVAGKSYLVFSRNSHYYMPDRAKHAQEVKEIERTNYFSGMKLEDYIGFEDEYAVEISKQLKIPVFVYCCQTFCSKPEHLQITVNGCIPVLSDIEGFASLVTAEQCYQEIAFYLSNVLTQYESIVSISDADKLKQHGFDVKQSFRHRK